MHIDISDDDKKSKLLSTSEKDELNKIIDEKNFNISIMNSQLKIVKDEKQYLTNELNNKNTIINELQERQIVTLIGLIKF